MAHKDLYIVDNSTENATVKKYLIDWCSVSKQMDIATGYLEIGGLLALDTLTAKTFLIYFTKHK